MGDGLENYLLFSFECCTTVVCARLPKAAVEKLDDIAAMPQMSRSELIKKIVLAFLTAWKQKLDKLAL